MHRVAILLIASIASIEAIKIGQDSTPSTRPNSVKKAGFGREEQIKQHRKNALKFGAVATALGVAHHFIGGGPGAAHSDGHPDHQLVQGHGGHAGDLIRSADMHDHGYDTKTTAGTLIGGISDTTQLSQDGTIGGYDIHANDPMHEHKHQDLVPSQYYDSLQTSSEIEAEIETQVVDGWNKGCAAWTTDPEFMKFKKMFHEDFPGDLPDDLTKIGFKKEFFMENAWTPFIPTPMVLKSFETVGSHTGALGYVMKAITAMRKPTFVLGALQYVESNYIPMYGALSLEYRVCGYLGSGKRVVATKSGELWNNFWLAEVPDLQEKDIGSIKSIKYSLKNSQAGEVVVTIKDRGAFP